jgi:negative regulator of flagellin synthesis FlgM
MKIGQLNNAAPVQPVSAERTAPQAGNAGPAQQHEASAQVELSSAAATMLSDDTAEFDAEKVARIADAIREGRFHPNAEVIADKLITNASELIGRAAH